MLKTDKADAILWKPETILQKCIEEEETFYWVKWAGLDDIFNSWETVESLDEWRSLINEFENNDDRKIEVESRGDYFWRVWKDNEVPWCVLGSSQHCGINLILVRIKAKDVNEDEDEDPYVGIDDDNTVMTLADDFAVKFPELMIKYYEEHKVDVLVEDEDSDNENENMEERGLKI